jgi:hypothetical protein
LRILTLHPFAQLAQAARLTGTAAATVFIQPAPTVTTPCHRLRQASSMVDVDARQEQLEHLQSITGLESEAAANLLDAAGGELDIAVALHFNYDDGPRAGAAAETGGMGPDSDSDESDEGEIVGTPSQQPLQRAAPAGRLGWVLKLLSGLPGYGIAVRVLGLLTGTG